MWYRWKSLLHAAAYRARRLEGAPPAARSPADAGGGPPCQCPSTGGSTQRRRSPVRGVLGCLLLGLCSGAARGASVPDDDQRLVEGLRQRRLYRLAELHCRRELARESLDGGKRRRLTVDLLRIWTEQAVQATPENRPPLWKKIDDFAAGAVADGEKAGPDVLVQTQHALAVLARGELARSESEVAPDPAAALDEARRTIREASRMLEALDQALAAAIPLARRTPPPDPAAGPSADELVALQGHVRFELARAFRNQALSYPEGSADRVASLTQSLATLERLTQLPGIDDALLGQIPLARAECHRLLKDYPAALADLPDPRAAGMSPSLRLRGRAERIRVHLASGNLAAAREVLAEGRDDGGESSADLDFAVLETYVAHWQAAAAARQDDEAAKWREKSIDGVRFVERLHGPYWGRRAEMLLLRTGAEKSDGSVEILRRAADDLYLKGRWDEALAAYDKAASASSADSRAAFELGYKAALVQRERSRHEDAAQRFRQLALRYREHPQAPGAHVLAIVHWAELCKADTRRLGQYGEWLGEHLTHWPYAATAPRVNLWLAGFREARRDWLPAIAAFQAVPPADETYAEALSGAERCWLAYLAERDGKGENVAEPALQAIRFFHDAAWSGGAQPPGRWTDANRLATLAVARLRLRFTAGARGETEQMLRQALAGTPPPSPSWKAAAQQMLAVAVADQPGRIDEARRIVGDIRDATPEQTLSMLRALATVTRRSQGTARRELAQLELAAGKGLWEQHLELPPETQVELARLRAAALAEDSQHAAAAAMLDAAIEQHQLPLSVHQELAEILLASSDRTLVQRSLERWRMIAAQALPRSPTWFQAKHGVARAMIRLGDAAGAAKLIRYLQATENLRQHGWERQFEELLQSSGNG